MSQAILSEGKDAEKDESSIESRRQVEDLLVLVRQLDMVFLEVVAEPFFLIHLSKI